MKTSKPSQTDLETIKQIQAERGTTRKSAIRYFHAHPELFKEKKGKAPKEAKIQPVKLTPEQAGAARKEGLRLFTLAGRPSHSDFRKVYGKDGAKMTWVARAAFAGLESAEKAASTFQKMLAAK